MKRLQSLVLDIMTIPGEFLEDEGFAKYKQKYVCPRCPPERRSLRDVDRTGECWWYKNWMAGNYDIPRSFGPWNWVTQYLFWRTDLEPYRKLHEERTLELVPEEITDEDYK